MLTPLIGLTEIFSLMINHFLLNNISQANFLTAIRFSRQDTLHIFSSFGFFFEIAITYRRVQWKLWRYPGPELTLVILMAKIGTLFPVFNPMFYFDRCSNNILIHFLTFLIHRRNGGRWHCCWDPWENKLFRLKAFQAKLIIYFFSF